MMTKIKIIRKLSYGFLSLVLGIIYSIHLPGILLISISSWLFSKRSFKHEFKIAFDNFHKEMMINE